MPFLKSGDGLKVHYEVEGTGPDVILVHGFAADLEGNWRQSGVTDALRDENRVVMIDCRGHGKSDKPKDPALYGSKMVDDITCLLDHLGIEKTNFVGYSMGSGLCLNLLLMHPERFKSVILGGFVLPDPGADPGTQRRNVVAEALLADSMEQVTNPVGREFRRFAEAMGADLKALAAVQLGSTQNAIMRDPEVIVERLRAVSVPLMTVVGNDDFLPGDKSRMAMMVPNGCHFQIEGKDHLTVVPDPKFRMMIRAFLKHVNSL